MHGIFFERASDLRAVEEEVFGGTQFDFVNTTITQGRHTVEDITWAEGASSLESVIGGTNRRLCTVYYSGTGDVSDKYADVANGVYDDDARRFARDLVARGMGDAFIRLDPEFNEPWSSAYPGDDGGRYADAYARTVSVMQSVDGANFRFLYCVAKNSIGCAPNAWPLDSSQWPSGEPAPIVSPSYYDDAAYYLNTEYDLAPPGSYEKFEALPESEQERLRKEAWVNEEKRELQAWVDFATQRGAKMGCVEWGISRPERGQNQPSGGDNAYYTRKMFEFFRNNNFVMQGTWQTDGDYGTMLPSSKSAFPDSSAEWASQVAPELGDSTDGSTDSGSTTDHQYGGYQLPEQGSLDWHKPVNQNFADIEADIKDLAKRVDDLEQA
jgi:hypothetical protein